MERKVKMMLFVLVTFLCFALVSDDTISLYKDVANKLSLLDSSMPSIESGDWLASNPEPGQTFEQYVVSHPVRPTGKRNAIYILPVGQFDTTQTRLLTESVEYLKTYFGLEVIVQPSLRLKSIPKSARRKNQKKLQLLTSYINYSILFPSRPKNAAAYLALTAVDLYPSKDWSFVFGEAD